MSENRQSDHVALSGEVEGTRRQQNVNTPQNIQTPRGLKSLLDKSRARGFSGFAQEREKGNTVKPRYTGSRYTGYRL